jgi:DNA repair exonuclease SbcCD ATPase subunit
MSKIIDAIFISNTNIFALITLIILTALALFGTYLPRFKGLAKYAKQSPAILATVGVFFSFWGISIGLIEFDATHMAESTPKLLEGLKVKFIASLMGIGFSIIVRIAQSFKPEIITDDSEKIIINLLTDIKYSLVSNNPELSLKELNNNIAMLPIEFKKQSNLLDAIKNSLSGDGDSSVTTQLGKVRIEIRDGFDNQNQILNGKFDNLTSKFDKFAESMIKTNQEALIEALKDVMRDFNAKINEQFGDNFKQLNEAVGKLLDWQKEYKTHVEKLEDNFNIALNSVESIKMAFGEIENRSQNFTDTSEELRSILVKLDRQVQNLSSHLQVFDELAGNAKNIFPIIEDNLLQLTTGFKNSTEQSLSDINATVKDVSHNLKNTGYEFRATAEQFSGMANNIEKSVKTQELTLTDVSDNFKKTIDNSLHDLAEQSKISIKIHERELQDAVHKQMNNISNAIESSSKLFNTLLTDNTTKSTSILEQQITLLDKALQDELKKSIEKMGSMLTSLSMQFVNDYTPLTAQLREVVRMAEKLKGGRN